MENEWLIMIGIEINVCTGCSGTVRIAAAGDIARIVPAEGIAGRTVPVEGIGHIEPAEGIGHIAAVGCNAVGIVPAGGIGRTGLVGGTARTAGLHSVADRTYNAGTAGSA